MSEKSTKENAPNSNDVNAIIKVVKELSSDVLKSKLPPVMKYTAYLVPIMLLTLQIKNSINKDKDSFPTSGEMFFFYVIGFLIIAGVVVHYMMLERLDTKTRNQIALEDATTKREIAIAKSEASQTKKTQDKKPE